MKYAKVQTREPATPKEEFDEEEPLSVTSRKGGEGSSEQDTLVQRPAQESAATPVLSTTGTFLRLTILVSVTLQNTSYALVRRYSRGHLKERYSTSSALLVMEIAKLLLSMWMVVFSGLTSDVPSGGAISKYVWLIAHSWKMMVPAAIYLVMNILGFVALGHLDASTFSIVAQMKVFTTAIFSVVILGKQMPMRKWRALTTLTLGVILISNEAMPKMSAEKHGEHVESKHEVEHKLKEFAIGMAASFGDVLLSGFVSIYFEMVLKSKTETFSVWDRNLQLAFWSSVIYAPIMMYDNPTDPFKGWSVVTLGCAAVGALGGVLVALSIKYVSALPATRDAPHHRALTCCMQPLERALPPSSHHPATMLASRAHTLVGVARVHGRRTQS